MEGVLKGKRYFGRSTRVEIGIVIISSLDSDSFIKREQEYRKTIEDIHNEIAKRSSDPFGFLSSSSINAGSVVKEDDEEPDSDY